MRPQGIWVLLLLVGGAASSQPARAENPLESIPPDVAAARQLHAPPRVAVEARTVKEPPEDAHCHDPACMAIVLPFVAFKEAFPDRHDAVTITVGKTRFEGTYEVGGRFLHGRIYSPEGSRFFARVELKELGKKLILETAHQRLDPKAPQEPTPVLPQVDLLADYRKALASESLPEKRVALVEEALSFLKAESLPFMREWLASPSETDEQKAGVLSYACGLDRPRMGWELSHALGQVALKVNSGPETQSAALFCLKDSESWKLPLPLKERLVQFVSAACHAEDSRVDDAMTIKALYALYYQSPPPPVPVKALVATCDRADRRAMLQTCMGAPATREDYAAAFKTPNKTAAQTWRCLHPDQPEFVGGCEAALLADPNFERLDTLRHRQPPPTAKEITAVAQRYAQPSQIKEGLYAWRGVALQIFHRAAAQPELTADARAVLREALKHPEVRKMPSRGGLIGLLDGVHRKLSQMNGEDKVAGGGEDPELRAALVALGEPSETLGAAAGLGTVLHRGIDHSEVSDGTTLIELSLSLAGCTDDEIRDAAQASKQTPKPPPGPFCRSQKPSAP